MDGTDIETYGRKKQRMAWNYEGHWVGRAHPATWTEAGVVLAGNLGRVPTIPVRPPRR